MLHSQVRQQGGQQNYPHLGLDTIEAQWGGLGKEREGSRGEKATWKAKKPFGKLTASTRAMISS